MDIETRQAKHIAMIMDGNRRYAKKLHLPAGVGHEKGAEKLSNVIKWCLEAEIKELTLYAFSMQNFHRKQEEVEGLFKLFRKHFAKLNDDKSIIEKKIRIKVVGRKHLFPNDIQESIAKIEEKTKQHDNLTINFAMAYGGREEIVDAARKIASEIKHNEITAEEIDNETFANHLYFKSDPDLVIRTGGDYRTSNFLPWQTVYSEWFFTQSLWPELNKEEFLDILNQFNNRERRFGK